MALRPQFVARFGWLLSLALSLAGVVFTRHAIQGVGPEASSASLCAGDCNDDGAVTVHDVLAAVNVALGIADIGTCSAADVNGDGKIIIDEILDAVNSARAGCPTPTPAMHTVVVGPGGRVVFDPPTLTIHVGDTVQWSWASSGHSVTSGGPDCVSDGQFCSPNDGDCAQAPLSNRDATYSHTFTAPGTYPYFCTPHCDFGMVGTITVE
jgi:plastocyanin